MFSIESLLLGFPVVDADCHQSHAPIETEEFHLKLLCVQSAEKKDLAEQSAAQLHCALTGFTVKCAHDNKEGMLAPDELGLSRAFFLDP